MSADHSPLRVVSNGAFDRSERRVFRAASVALRVADLERSIAFYCRGLGLALRYRVADTTAEVEAEGLTIGLVARRGARERRHAGSPATAIAFEVDDLVEARARLRRRGVRVGGAIEHGDLVRALRFHDPDGHELVLCEVLWGPGVHAGAG